VTDRTPGDPTKMPTKRFRETTVTRCSSAWCSARAASKSTLEARRWTGRVGNGHATLSGEDLVLTMASPHRWTIGTVFLGREDTGQTTCEVATQRARTECD